jgi:hypothetical protein
MSRRFLYLSPFFPPQSRVGALRPLKFVRYLPQHGWDPVVVAGLKPTDAVDLELFDAVPASTQVIFDYNRGAETAFQALKHHPQSQGGTVSWSQRILPESVLPTVEHTLDMAHAYAAGKEALRRYDCQAIVVNADPYAALLVGRRLAAKFNLPLLSDLRDPWAPCQLRRPKWPAPVRRAVDAIERQIVESSRWFVVNTDNALAAYRKHYADVSPQKFVCIRNHHDASLSLEGPETRFGRFTLLHLGNFRRLVPARGWFEVLAELARRGIQPKQLQFVVTGQLTDDDWARADALGIRAFIRRHPHVNYRYIAGVMDAADALVFSGHEGAQRVPAKIYDYLTSARPLIGLSDNPEVEQLVSTSRSGLVFSLDDASGAADAVLDEMARGRQRRIDKDIAAYSSSAAAERLAALLDQASVA